MSDRVTWFMITCQGYRYHVGTVEDNDDSYDEKGNEVEIDLENFMQHLADKTEDSWVSIHA